LGPNGENIETFNISAKNFHPIVVLRSLEAEYNYIDDKKKNVFKQINF